MTIMVIFMVMKVKGVIEGGAPLAFATPAGGTMRSMLGLWLIGALGATSPPAQAKRLSEQARLEAGNRAWDAAVSRKQAEREAAIEEEAQRIQANLEAERRREAETEARRPGGKLDSEGNFVDPDLEEHK